MKKGRFYLKKYGPSNVRGNEDAASVHEEDNHLFLQDQSMIERMPSISNGSQGPKSTPTKMEKGYGENSKASPKPHPSEQGMTLELSPPQLPLPSNFVRQCQFFLGNALSISEDKVENGKTNKDPQILHGPTLEPIEGMEPTYQPRIPISQKGVINLDI